MRNNSMKKWRLTARIFLVVGIVIMAIVVIAAAVALHLASQSQAHLSDAFSLTMAIFTGIASAILFVSIIISEIAQIKERKDHSSSTLL